MKNIFPDPLKTLKGLYQRGQGGFQKKEYPIF
jgi:hypothetical protein